MTGLQSDELDPVEVSLLRHIEAIEPTDDQQWQAMATGIAPMTAATLLEAQITSRLIDHTARWLRAAHGLGHYTIGSAGHEANALVALALRPTDPALLHYRSGGFYVARSLQAQQAGHDVGDPIDDILRGMLARSTEPIAGGRHKVFGHRQLSIIPQTSTIASHLPRAVGLAHSFDLGTEVGLRWPDDSVVVASFGDGSLNHSTAQGALNWASQLAHAGRRVPVVFVCEDNGIGLSVPTTPNWVADSLGSKPAMDYLRLDATTMADDGPGAALARLTEAVDRTRSSGRPAVVHLDTVRFLGHAGTDVETAYRRPEELRADLERDPILATARQIVACGVCSSNEIVGWYHDLRESIRERAMILAEEPALDSGAEVMEPLAQMQQLKPSGATTTASTSDRLTLAQSINRTMGQLLDDRAELIVFGEDVGRKGGVYGVTRGLQKRFGHHRVFDTVLDEQSVLGLALGSSLNGFVPIPEIQYLAYLHNAEDQIRGEAASLAFFSQGQFHNPMVIRVASYAYQRGFGGHFHNDNSVAVLRDIPGLVIASPAHPTDAKAMLRTCVDHVVTTGAVSVFLEPIALYHTTDLHQPGDQGWTTGAAVDLADGNIEGGNVEGAGRVDNGLGARRHGDGRDLTIMTWANGLYLSLRAARTLARDHGVMVRVLDLRWLAPMPIDQMLTEAELTGRVLIVDETRRTGGVGEGITAELSAGGFTGTVERIAGLDSYVPLGAAANHVLVSEDDIVTAALAMCR